MIVNIICHCHYIIAKIMKTATFIIEKAWYIGRNDLGLYKNENTKNELIIEGFVNVWYHLIIVHLYSNYIIMILQILSKNNSNSTQNITNKVEIDLAKISPQQKKFTHKKKIVQDR